MSIPWLPHLVNRVQRPFLFPRAGWSRIVFVILNLLSLLIIIFHKLQLSLPSQRLQVSHSSVLPSTSPYLTLRRATELNGTSSYLESSRAIVKTERTTSATRESAHLHDRNNVDDVTSKGPIEEKRPETRGWRLTYTSYCTLFAVLGHMARVAQCIH